MNKVFRRRPSPSMLVATIALIFGASGSAIAANTLVSGDKLIKKHSLSANRLRDFTITRRQVNFSKLGTVPSAKDANFATIAGTATHANDAASLDGYSPGSFEPAADTVRSGFVRIQQNTSVTLATFGPFTLTASCVSSSGTWDAKITVGSSQEGSEVDGSTISGTQTLADTGPFSVQNGQTEAKQTGVDFASYNASGTDVAYWGDVMIIGEYGGLYSDSCMASALVTAS
jgi:hypothetical protein